GEPRANNDCSMFAVEEAQPVFCCAHRYLEPFQGRTPCLKFVLPLATFGCEGRDVTFRFNAFPGVSNSVGNPIGLLACGFLGSPRRGLSCLCILQLASRAGESAPEPVGVPPSACDCLRQIVEGLALSYCRCAGGIQPGEKALIPGAGADFIQSIGRRRNAGDAGNIDVRTSPTPIGKKNITFETAALVLGAY